MKRREFLQGLFGAAVGITSTSAEPKENNLEEQKQFKQQVAKNVVGEHSHESIQDQEFPWELVGTHFDMSRELRTELILYMTDLMRPEGFNALRALNNAEVAYSREESLRTHAARIFEERLRSTPLGRYLSEQDPSLLGDMVQLAIDGQVPTESRWYNTPVDIDPVAVGYWQITPSAQSQIALERNLSTQSSIDRRDLSDSTRGAAELHAAHYRMMSAEITLYQETFGVSPKEGCIPLLLTAYIYGPSLRHIIRWYTDNYTSEPALPGLDRTLHLFDMAYSAKNDDGTKKFSRFQEHSLSYAKKCIAVAEIAMLQRTVNKSFNLE